MSLEIVLLGPPGAGKGTHASHLKDAYRIPHISTGDMLRENLDRNTDLGIEAKSYMEKGELVPDALVTRMVEVRLSESDAQQGFMLDGYPRTPEQAKDLDTVLEKMGRSLRVVLYVKSNQELILTRLTGRRVCKSCSKIYNIPNFPPPADGKCDDCGGEVIQRKDDSRETVLKRLNVYQEQTAALIEHYRNNGLLKDIDGDLPFEETQAQIKEQLNPLLV